MRGRHRDRGCRVWQRHRARSQRRRVVRRGRAVVRTRLIRARVVGPSLAGIQLTVAARVVGSVRAHVGNGRTDLAAVVRIERAPPSSASNALAGTAAALAKDHWSVLPPAPIAVRSGAASAWTGRQLLIWGGDAGSARRPTRRRRSGVRPDARSSGRSCPRLPSAPAIADGERLDGQRTLRLGRRRCRRNFEQTARSTTPRR